MRYKNMFTFLQSNRSRICTRRFSNQTIQYSEMVNITNAYKHEMEDLGKNMATNEAYMDSIYHQLGVLITYHSLMMTDNFSMTLDEATNLLHKNKTSGGCSFENQLSASNHYRIFNYCVLYQKQLKDSGWRYSSTIDTPNEKNLRRVLEMPVTFAIIFLEGRSFIITDNCGGYFPLWAYYSMTCFDSNEIIKKGVNILIQTIKHSTDDHYMNAAMIHNVFAKGYPSDEKFGLMFSRLYMNFALMLTGHAPAIIDSSHQAEYFELAHPDKLDDPKPMAYFLMKNLQHTYKNYVLPNLAAEANKYECKHYLD